MADNVENYEKNDEQNSVNTSEAVSGADESYSVRQYPWEDVPPKPVDEETAALIAELEEDLGQVQNFKRVTTLIEQEIARLRNGKEPEYIDVDNYKPITVVKKILVPVHKNPRFNFVGKLLGPGGRTLQQMIQQSRCKIYILGRGSSRTKDQEAEQLATGEPKYAHLAEPLHVRVECTAPIPVVYQKLGQVFEQLKHYLIPVRDDVVQQQLAEMGIPPGTSTYRPPIMGGGPQRRPFIQRGATRGDGPRFRGRGFIQRGNIRPSYNGPQQANTGYSYGYGQYSEFNTQQQGNATNAASQYVSNQAPTPANYGANQYSYGSAANPNAAGGYPGTGNSSTSQSQYVYPNSSTGGDSYMNQYGAAATSAVGSDADTLSYASSYSYDYGHGAGGGIGYGNVGSYTTDGSSQQQYGSPGKAPAPPLQRTFAKPSPY